MKELVLYNTLKNPSASKISKKDASEMKRIVIELMNGNTTAISYMIRFLKLNFFANFARVLLYFRSYLLLKLQSGDDDAGDDDDDVAGAARCCEWVKKMCNEFERDLAKSGHDMITDEGKLIAAALDQLKSSMIGSDADAADGDAIGIGIDLDAELMKLVMVIYQPVFIEWKLWSSWKKIFID